MIKTTEKISVYWMNFALILIGLASIFVFGLDFLWWSVFLFLNLACFYRARSDRAAELKKEGDEE